ncbi:MAG: hypothetical protein ACLPPV_09470 [Candidatus Korobacteraceae bacterium]|jgi:hypothetical protein
MASGNQLGLSIANTDTPDQEFDMSSLWPSALASLDDSLALPFASVDQLRAANSIDIEEIIKQLETAAESAQALRALVSEQLPEASWQNREELNALLEKIPKRAQTSSAEQPHSEQPPLPVAVPETAFELDAVVQSGSTLTAAEYTAQTSSELVGTNPLFYGNTFNNVSMLPMHSAADQLPFAQRRVMSWITAIGALVAAIAVIGFGISLQRQLGKLHIQLVQSSEATTRMLQDEMRTDQRAWVGLTEATVRPLTASGGGFTIKLQNTGKTPALDLQVADVATIEDLDQAGPAQEPNVTASAGTLMPGAVYTTDVWFTTSPDAVSGLTKDRLRAANYVYVTYKDVFQKTHATKACFYWRKSLPRVKPCDSYNELN